MRKVKWSMMFLIFMLVFVSACSSGSNTNNGSENSNSSSVTPNNETDETKEDVTLRLWFPGTGSVEDAINSLIDKYESENAHITIDYEAVPWAEFFQKLSVGYAGGNAPDIHGLGYGKSVV